MDSALKITNALFRGKLADLDTSERHDAVKNMEKTSCPDNQILEDVLVNTHIASSKREAREWIKGNSISVNGVKVQDVHAIISSKDAYVDGCVIIRRGKKRYYCLELQ